MEFLVGIYLNIKEPIITMSGEYISLWVAVYCLILVCFFIPGAWILVMSSKLSVIQNSRKFNRKWGALYEGIKTKSKITIAFYLIFYLRRLFFVMLVFTNPEITMVKI